MYCLSHYSSPSLPPGLSLYIICLSLNKPQGPYLLSSGRHFKPNLSYSLCFTGQQWAEVSPSAPRGDGLATHLPVHSKLLLSCFSSASNKTVAMSATKPRSRFWSPSSLISQTSLRFVVRTIRAHVVPGMTCSQSVLWQSTFLFGVWPWEYCLTCPLCHCFPNLNSSCCLVCWIAWAN